MKKSIIYSFVVNIFGLVSLFVVDTLISKSNDVDLISSWALMKSTLFIGVLFVLLGLDQSIVRLKLKLEDIFAMAIVQFVLIIGLMASLLYIFDYRINIPLFIVSIFFLSISYILFATHRLQMHYMISQVYLQGWKVVLIALLVSFGLYAFEWTLPLSLLVIVLGFGGKDIFRAVTSRAYNYQLYKRSFSTGLHYFVSMATLTISLYFDQLLLNYDAKTIESSQLFSHITFFVSPVAIFLGFAGFVIGPYLRNNPDKKVIFFKKIILSYLLIGIIMAFSSYFVGSFLFGYFKPHQETSLLLAGSLVIVVFLRYLYILPSAYLGSFASNALIRQVTIINAIGLALYLAVYFFISTQTEDYLLAIVCAMLTAWTIRILNGYYAIFLIFKKGNSESI